MSEDKGILNGIKRTVCEVYSRVTGYIRPISVWNSGKKEEFKNRKTYKKTCCGK